MTTSTLDPSTLEGLTDKQREVLSLHNEGKNPTEIGRELSISSQAVHGHFRRLRERGLVPDTGAAAKPAARRRTSGAATPVSNGGFDVSSVIAAVKLAAAEQHRALDLREAEIDAQIDRLKGEKVALNEARKELDQLIPSGTA